TCAMPAAKANGRTLITLEGVSPEDRDLIARAFVAAAGVQCGFCTPGFALRAKHLVDANPTPTRQQIAKAVDGHLCRCTGYQKIIDAVEIYARARRGEPIVDAPIDGGVGASIRRVRGTDATLGMQVFVDDIVRPNMLHGTVVLSPHPRAKVLGIDTSAARA